MLNGDQGTGNENPDPSQIRLQGTQGMLFRHSCALCARDINGHRWSHRLRQKGGLAMAKTQQGLGSNQCKVCKTGSRNVTRGSTNSKTYEKCSNPECKSHNKGNKTKKHGPNWGRKG